VDDRVEFQGTVGKKDVPRWISRGDIFLNTTNVDNTPVSVVEAMACGTCIVSTDVGGVPYLLEHEHDALLVPPRDPDAMAAAVGRVLTEPDLPGRLSANARLKAVTFDWSAVLGEWERLLRSLEDGREPVYRAAERSFQS
jgi:glycosyltransferase involved in cell wall biosynthesis